MPSSLLESLEFALLEQLVYLKSHPWDLAERHSVQSLMGRRRWERTILSIVFFYLLLSFTVVESIFVLWHKLEHLRAG